MANDTVPNRWKFIRLVGLLAGPALSLLTYALLGLEVDADAAKASLTEPGRRVAAITVLMAIWWLTEALPLAATALVPVAILPVIGVIGIKEVAAPYASDIIFLFAGGLLLGIAMERWDLHRRIALITISLVGTQPALLVAGFMLATAVMSMWVSNTATAVMMLPIAVSVIGLVTSRIDTGDADGTPAGRNFALCLLLGIAYAASIGGIGTLIGTPPNALLAGFVADTPGLEMPFSRWLWIGLPFVVLFLPWAWLLLTRFIFPLKIPQIPGGREFIRTELRSLGRMSPGEWATFIIFMCAALLWVRQPILQIVGLVLNVEPLAALLANFSDAGIAILAALALFIVPVNLRTQTFVLDWKNASRIPFEVLILFGGGLALAAAISATGLDAWIGSLFSALKDIPPILLVLIVCTIMIFLTELTSNTAVTATFLPILYAASGELGVHPYLLLIPAVIAASCAFMLPMATPPNAIVFSSGHVTIPRMAAAGVWLNLSGIVLITALVYFFGGWLLGADLSVPPGMGGGE